MCSSSVQCIFYFINYGPRRTGGIGDDVPKISFKNDTSLFFAQFVFNVIFHIFVVYLLANIFLGLVVDTFADLRDKNQLREYDRKYRCFICQLNSDDCIKKKINFKSHIKDVHNVWNYVYFLSHIFVKNKNEYTPIERSTYSKLDKNDLTWIPVDSSNS